MPANAAQKTRAEFVRHRNGDRSPAKVEVKPGATVGAAGPRVSILIPTSDGQRHGYLPQLLEDIRGQSYQDIETIIVAGDTRQGRALNYGAELARGEFILTFDDDSRLGTPEVIATLVTAMDADPTIGMAGCENRVPADAGWFVRRLMYEVPRRSSPPVTAVTDTDLAEHPCLMMRKHAFYGVGGEHEIIPRGLDPYLRREFRVAGHRVVIVPGIWIHHLPPPTFRIALRQFFRNGRMSALVSKHFPDLALDNALSHGDTEIQARPIWFRAARHASRLVVAMVTLKWIYLATAVAYGLGVLSGIVAPETWAGKPETSSR
jgi:glycosyltransferase involved in cell wall biosynthesis